MRVIRACSVPGFWESLIKSRGYEETGAEGEKAKLKELVHLGLWAESCWGQHWHPGTGSGTHGPAAASPGCSIPSLQHLPAAAPRSFAGWAGRADLGHPDHGTWPPWICSKQNLSTDLFLVGRQKLNSDTSTYKPMTSSHELNSGNI